MSSRIDYSNPERAFEQLTGMKRSSAQGSQPQQGDPALSKRVTEIQNEIGNTQREIEELRRRAEAARKRPRSLMDSFGSGMSDEGDPGAGFESLAAAKENRLRVRQNELQYIQQNNKAAPKATVKDYVKDVAKAIPRGAAKATVQTAGLVGLVNDDAGKAVNDYADSIGTGDSWMAPSEASKYDTALDLTNQVAEGVGSMAPYVATEGLGYAARGLSIAGRGAEALRTAEGAAELTNSLNNINRATRGGQAVIGSGQGVSQQQAMLDNYEERTGEQVDPTVRFFAKAAGGAIGLSEVVTMGTLFKSVPKQLKPDFISNTSKILEGLATGAMDKSTAFKAIVGSVQGLEKNAAGRILLGMAEEGTQEGSAQLAQNVVARVGYDENQSITEGVAENALLGAAVGGITRGGREAISALSGANGEEQANQREDADLMGALQAYTSQREPSGSTLQLEDQNAVAMRDMGTMRVGGLNLTAPQVLEFAANNANNPRIADIMSQPVADTTKVEQVARILNAEQAARVEPEAVRRIGGMVGGTTPVSTTRQFIRDELSQIGEEVINESSVLSAIRDAVATDGKGKSFVNTLRSITDSYTPAAAEGQTFVARPERGGDGSVVMTPDQTAEEAQREREAQQAFRMAERRQQRFDQATGQGTQREDIRPGAPEPEAQFFLGDAYGDLAGTAATVVESATPGVFRVQYDSPTETDANGNPVTISEEVPALDLLGRVVRGTPRMTQELAGDVRKPRNGTGTDMNPRQSVDRTTTRAIAEAQQPQPPMVAPEEPNLTMTGRQEQPFEAPPSLNAQENPAPDNAAPEGTVESQGQVSGAPGATALPAPPRSLPAPEAQEAPQQEDRAEREAARSKVAQRYLAARKRANQLKRDGVITMREKFAMDRKITSDIDAAEKELDALENPTNYDDHPLMQEHDAKFDGIVSEIEDAENVKGLRKIANRLVKDGVIDDTSDMDDAIDSADKGYKLEDGQAALVDLVDQAREDGRLEVETQIDKQESGEQYSGRKDRVREPRVKASEVVARTQPEAQQETQQEAEQQEETVDYESVINDRLDKIAEKGAQGRVIAKRLKGLLKDKSLSAPQLYYAIRMGEVFARVLPKNAKIDILFVPSMKATNAMAAAASGTTLGADVTGSYKPYEISQNGFRGLITMSLAEDMLSVSRENAAHEAFHVIQDMLRVYDPDMFNAINSYFKDGMRIDDLDPSILRKLKSLTLDGDRSVYQSLKDDFGDTPLGRFEAQAVAFGALVDAKDRGENMKGLKASIARFVDMLSNLRRGLRNVMRKPGSDKLVTIADVFEGFRTGESQEYLEDAPAPLADGSVDEQYSGRKGSDQGEFKKNIKPQKLSSDEIFAQPDVKQGTMNVTEAALAIQERTLNILGRAITAPGQQDALLSKTLAHEVKAELQRSGKRNASGWYTEEMRKATAVASLMHPEIASDVGAQLGFTAALAITSQNQSVDFNTVYAERWYEQYKKTGKFPENEGWGKAASSIMSNAKLFNTLVERFGAATVSKFFATKFSVRELKAAGFKNVSGASEEMVYGSAVLGPKIGFGFYSNLNGRYDPITIDMWFMRTWGRVTGDLIGASDELVAEQQQRLINALRDEGRPTNAYGDELLEIAREEFKKFEKDFKDNRADYDSGKKVKSEVALAAQRLVGSFEDTKDAPKADWQRTWIRDVVAGAQQILQKDGINITNADFQAIIWYPEKRLWSKKYGVREKGKGADDAGSAGETSYFDEFVRIAKSRGFTDVQIQSAIQPTRGRGQGSGGVLGGQAVNQQAGGQSSAANEFSAGEARRFIQDAIVTRINQDFPIFDGNGSGPVGQPSGHVIRKSGGNLARNLEGRVPVAATYSHSLKAKNAFEVSGIDAVKFHELTTGPAAAKLYHRLISEAKNANKAGAAVYVYDQAEYADMRLFLSEDGLVGFALKGNDVVSVFKHPNAGARGAAVPLIRMATWLGGRKLDAYDTVLPRIYSTAGYKVAARIPWNDSQAEPTWDKEVFKAFNNGEPDVVFMVYDPTRTDFYREGEGPTAKDYDDAVARQTAAVKGEQYSGRRGASILKKRLSSAELVAYARSLADTYDGYDDGLDATFGGKQAELRSVPIDKLTFGNEYQDDVVEIYQSMKTPAPPVIVDNGVVVDGNNRLQAAINRGERSVLAYVITTDEQYSARTGRRPAAPNRPLRPMPQFTNTNPDEPSRLDDVIYNLQDKLIDVKRLQQNIEKSGKKIGEDANVYRAEELYHGRAAKRAKDFVSRELSPLIQDMKSKNISLEMFDEFLHARHAKERNAQIRKVNPNMQDGGSGMTDAEADAYMQSLPNARRLQLEKLAGRVDAIVQETQKMTVAYGLETQATIDNWNSTYKAYVPLQREGFEDDIAGSGAQGLSVRGNSSRRAMGSSLGVVDVLANVAMQRERVITRGERNLVGNAMVKLALENPNDGFWFVVDPKSKSTAMAEQKLVAFGVDPVDAKEIVGLPTERFIDPRTGRLVVRANSRVGSQPNVLATRINGEDRYVVFNARNPRAARTVASLKNLDAAQIGSVLATVGKATRYFAAINTQYNPAFGLYNLMRDVQGAVINLGDTPLANDKAKVISHVLTAGVGMYRDLRAERSGGTATSNWAQMAEEFELAGGKTGFRDMFRNSQERADSITRELDPSRLQKIGDTTVGPVFNWLSDFNESIENSVRLSVYKVARDKGLSIEESASIAKNITVNFNRKGAIGTQTGMIYAFFNASVQGTARMAQALTGPAGKKIIAGGLLLGVMQAVALAAAGFDDDEIPDWLKDKNLVIPVGNGKYAAIPMPLGYHVIPAFARRATEFFMSDKKSAVGEGIELLGLFADAFNPIGNGGTLAETLSPTVTDPIVQLQANRDFAGRPIYNENFNSLDPTPGPERTREGASIIGEYIARAIDSFSGGNGYVPGKFSPTGDEVDFAIGTVTGGAGRTILNTVATVKAGVTGEDLPNYKIPFVGRMVGDKNEAAAVSGRFYENLKEVNGHQRTIKGMKEKGEDTTAYFEKNPGAYFSDSEAQGYERQVTKLKKERKELIAEGDKEGAALVGEELQQLMVEFNQRYMDAQKGQ